jgi:hypothetical protein
MNALLISGGTAAFGYALRRNERKGKAYAPVLRHFI